MVVIMTPLEYSSLRFTTPALAEKPTNDKDARSTICEVHEQKFKLKKSCRKQSKCLENHFLEYSLINWIERKYSCFWKQGKNWATRITWGILGEDKKHFLVIISCQTDNFQSQEKVILEGITSCKQFTSLHLQSQEIWVADESSNQASDIVPKISDYS